MNRRLGRFYLDNDVFRNIQPGDRVVHVFDGMVVIAAKQEWSSDRTEYLAIHPDFREVPLGEIAPVYAATLIDGSTGPTWVETDA